MTRSTASSVVAAPREKARRRSRPARRPPGAARRAPRGPPARARPRGGRKRRVDPERRRVDDDPRLEDAPVGARQDDAVARRLDGPREAPRRVAGDAVLGPLRARALGVARRAAAASATSEDETLHAGSPGAPGRGPYVARRIPSRTPFTNGPGRRRRELLRDLDGLVDDDGVRRVVLEEELVEREPEEVAVHRGHPPEPPVLRALGELRVQLVAARERPLDEARGVLLHVGTGLDVLLGAPEHLRGLACPRGRSGRGAGAPARGTCDGGRSRVPPPPVSARGASRPGPSGGRAGRRTRRRPSPPRSPCCRPWRRSARAPARACRR